MRSSYERETKPVRVEVDPPDFYSQLSTMNSGHAEAIKANYAQVRAQFEDAVSASGRSSEEVELMVVSKTWSAEVVSTVAELGHRVFGENRLQEGQEKIPVMEETFSNLDWHFIGTLQRNKVRKVLPLFGTIHSLSGLKLAQAVDRIAGELGMKAQGYLEVNLGEEASKHGFSPSDLTDNAAVFAQFQHLRLQGLMCIPPQSKEKEPRVWFSELRELRDKLVGETGLALPGLSMGMSGDFAEAIAEGSTVVRVGSAIFGAREKK